MADEPNEQKPTSGPDASEEKSSTAAPPPKDVKEANAPSKDGSDAHPVEAKDASPQEPAADAQPKKEPYRVPASHTRALFILVGVLAAVSIVGVLFLTHHRHSREAAQAETAEKEESKGPPVLVTNVTMTPPHRTMVLPADTKAILATTLYAKTSGYVVDVKTDKGFHCKKGDVLAVLQSPEVDEQVASARADLDVKKRSSARNDELAKSGIVSEQTRDQAAGDYRASAANLLRAQVLSGYEIIRAPFDGVVTARYVDPGALVPAATGSTQTAMPVVDVANVDTIRAVVYLGQDIAGSVHTDDEVKLWQDEHPEQTWPAKITRLAGTLDPRTRTELAEVWFDNRERGITPGVYLRAELQVKIAPTPLVSTEALVTRGGKSHVAVVRDNVAHLVPITVGYSDGRSIQVVSGLKGDEQVGMNIPPEVVDGSKVNSVPSPPQESAKL